MHLHFLRNIPCADIVASGFFDTLGLYRKCNQAQKNAALEWMAVFGIVHLKDRTFLKISTGEQRLVLLARVFVKNPDLLILDEPFHGLDRSNKEKVGNIIGQFCGANGKSLIFVSHHQDEIPQVVDKSLALGG